MASAHTYCAALRSAFPKEYVCTDHVSSVVGKYTLYPAVVAFDSSTCSEESGCEPEGNKLDLGFKF